MLKTPLLVPPPFISIVPAFTLTVPVLLNTVPMLVVVFDCLLKVPLLLKVPTATDAAVEGVGIGEAAGVVEGVCFRQEMALLPLPVLPVQVVLPAFRLRPPDSVLPFGPLMVSVPAKVVLCAAVPLMVPPVQVARALKDLVRPVQGAAAHAETPS